jgi:hypothetical protein
MNAPNVMPDSDTLLASLLVVGTIALCIFRLGSVLARPKAIWRQDRTLCGLHKDGERVFAGPDGYIAKETRRGNSRV